MNDSGVVGQGDGGVDGVGVWMCVHDGVCAHPNVGVCDNMCV